MNKPENSEVPAEIPTRSRGGADEDAEKSRRQWEAFFASIEAAKGYNASGHHEDEASEEVA